jgi:hypothetical protein
LYEQHFSRRMSFADYQRQIEVVNEPAFVEQWKEQARKITTFTSLREQIPATFASAEAAERHFGQTYLPGMIRTTQTLTVDGASSRCLPDRALNRLIETEWSRETQSPSQMMAELATQFREAGLHIFRHRRGMLFVSPIRTRSLAQDGTVLAPSVSAIVGALRGAPGMNRKDLAEKLLAGPATEEQEGTKLALASDLHWLIREGYVIEFNDGTLDLSGPRAATAKALAAALPTAESKG